MVTVQLLLQCLRISGPPVLSVATAVVGQVHCCKPRAVQSYIKCWNGVCLSQHGGSNPTTFADKEAFKQHIKSMARDFHNEVNFQVTQCLYGHNAVRGRALNIVFGICQRHQSAVGF
jgi:hypothetical protein